MSPHRGRKPNEARELARLMAAPTFSDHACHHCGGHMYYTSSGACVQCSINRGKQRYAENRAAISAQDHARYERRKLLAGGGSQSGGANDAATSFDHDPLFDD